jgi:hypothetical protein
MTHNHVFLVQRQIKCGLDKSSPYKIEYEVGLRNQTHKSWFDESSIYIEKHKVGLINQAPTR